MRGSFTQPCSMFGQVVEVCMLAPTQEVMKELLLIICCALLVLETLASSQKHVFKRLLVLVHYTH